MSNPLPRTTILFMFPVNSESKFKYCFEMQHYGGDQRSELEAWCLQDSENRRWGNMGYVSCNKNDDAMEFITHWGINWRHTPNSIHQKIAQQLKMKNDGK